MVSRSNKLKLLTPVIQGFPSMERGVACCVLEELPPTIPEEQNVLVAPRLELLLEDIEGS